MGEEEKVQEAVMIPSMSEKTAIKVAMKARDLVQVDVADRMGITQSCLSGCINRKRMSMEFFQGVMNAMGYDVAVIDREDGSILCNIWTEDRAL